MCLLTISCQKHPTESCQIGQKIAVFIDNIFEIYKKPYPFEFGGGWDLLVFHLYFPVIMMRLHNERKTERKTVKSAIYWRLNLQPKSIFRTNDRFTKL